MPFKDFDPSKEYATLAMLKLFTTLVKTFMKKNPCLIFLICLSSFCSAQNNSERITDSIVTEGKKLYRSEMASWTGTDIFLEKYKDQRPNVGGYFSYADNDSTKCIFFSKDNVPVVLGTIAFDSTYKATNATIDTDPRSFNAHENAIYTIRKLALAEIKVDTMFKMYENTNYNLIPFVDSGEKKVYVLTGPQQNGVVIFGNDYLLTYDDQNNLVYKKQLHKNIISIKYGNTGQQEVAATMHTHLPETGAFITSTDICTLMLYQRYAKWKQHYVISATYVSIWDCEKNTLFALTKKAWDNIYKDQEKRHGE